MAERPYSRYTRAKTWAALYAQHITACYALVPYSATNNSIAVIRCTSPEETQRTMRELLTKAEACAEFYGMQETPDPAPAPGKPASHAGLHQTPDPVPPFLAKARHAVVLARSSDYYHYSLADYPELRLIVCGLHDSYVHLPVWETRTNTRYRPRDTAIALTSPDFDRLRCTQFGHAVLVGALLNGDATALDFFQEKLPPRTQSRLTAEVATLREKRYRGRPLAFLTEAKRHEIGQKISDGLHRSYAQRWLHAR